MTSATTTTTTEFRAVIVCAGDPCETCRAPRTEHVLDEPRPTEAEARAHGQRLAAYAYGASTHQVQVQSRQVTDWATVS